MRICIVEAFRHIQGLGIHVNQGHFDLEDDTNGNIILPELWVNTIKPGMSIKMKMWPNTQSHNSPGYVYRISPVVPSPRVARDFAARQERISRMKVAHLGPNCPRPVVPRPPLPMNATRPPPMPPFGTCPPRMKCANSGRPMPIRSRRRRAPSISTIDENELTAAEAKELLFVNFVEELERMKNMTGTAMLTKYTQLQDVPGQECIDDWSVNCSAESSMDSDSSGSSGSEGIVD